MSKVRTHEVYSWRLSAKLKTELEAAARDEKASVDAILSRIVRAWLATRIDAGDADTLTRGSAVGFSEGPNAYLPGAGDARSRVRQRRSSGRRQSKVEDDAEQQQRLREQLLRAAGTVSIGLGPYTNERVREVMGEALEKKYRESQRRAPRRSR